MSKLKRMVSDRLGRGEEGHADAWGGSGLGVVLVIVLLILLIR